MGTPEDAAGFFPDRWKEARAVSDTERVFYKGFEVRQGSTWEVLGPSVMACSLRAMSKGHGVGVPVGDPMQMPGLFYAIRDQILWKHDFAHAGDHPDFEALPGLLPEPSSRR
ncbi:MAG: hypothetical protein DIJKHBIC_00301 [Thermoanaerobaculia bacterium]|nr:hypothetical protein [Thermoanaerobaculia bacterium]